MARCPECKTKIAPWRPLVPETKAKPLVCRKCGAILRMKPGWLVRMGAFANAVAVIALPAVFPHRRDLRIATFIFLNVVVVLCLYGLFAPAEKADTVEGVSVTNREDP